MPPFLLQLILNKYTAALVLLLSVLGYIYFLRSSVATLRSENTTLVLTVEQQQKVIAQVQADVKSVIAAKDAYVTAAEDLAKKKKALGDTLYRENRKKKSLEELAIKKTALIQKKVNDATQKVFKCFQVISKGGNC